MSVPLELMVFFAALLLWLALLLLALKTRRFGAFLAFGVLFMIVLNTRYFVSGAADSIAFFVGIYDVPDNLGLDDPAAARALVPCVAGQQCSIWGEGYALHPSWGVAFYQRFAEGDLLRDGLLYGHIFFNTLAFVLVMLQLVMPGDGAHPRRHRGLGYATLVSATAGVACASILAAEHGTVEHYGGALSMWGFWFMGACVMGCAGMGLVRIRGRDFASHRRWMFRFAGSLWGSFWLFRVMLFVLGPLLRGHDTAAILVCIWASAPLGIAIGELIQRRLVRTPAAASSDPVAIRQPM